MTLKRQIPSGFRVWRSLPRSSKLFLALSLIEATVAGSFSTQQLLRAPQPTLYQDLILIIVSAICFLFLVLDAFYHENGYQLIACTASAAINLAQLILYATALNGTIHDDVALAVAASCAVLQLLVLLLARYAYLGFGWRMYSRVPNNILLPDAEKYREKGLRLQRFSALAKFALQLVALLLAVGLVNGINPNKEEDASKEASTPVLPLLLVVAGLGCGTAVAWLAACWFAVARGKVKLKLAAEFCHPVLYVLAGAYIMSGAHYGQGGLDQLGQVHGEVGLIAYAVLFVVGSMAVWWDARLLVVDEYGDSSDGDGPLIMSKQQQDFANLPKELIPLVQGAWLLKLPSGSSNSSSNFLKDPSPLKKAAVSFFPTSSSSGRWRYFQLSHDGSTLRWDWRKFILLLHVEQVLCEERDLSIILTLTLEPDLKIRFQDPELYESWGKGLKLLLRLLGNPDGLHATTSQLSSSTTCNEDGSLTASSSFSSPSSSFAGASTGGRHLPRMESSFTFSDPGSPSRILHRLASASARPSAAGLVSATELEAAAAAARRALRASFEANPASSAQEEFRTTTSLSPTTPASPVAPLGGLPAGGSSPSSAVITVHAIATSPAISHQLQKNNIRHVTNGGQDRGRKLSMDSMTTEKSDKSTVSLTIHEEDDLEESRRTSHIGDEEEDDLEESRRTSHIGDEEEDDLEESRRTSHIGDEEEDDLEESRRTSHIGDEEEDDLEESRRTSHIGDEEEDDLEESRRTSHIGDEDDEQSTLNDQINGTAKKAKKINGGMSWLRNLVGAGAASNSSSFNTKSSIVGEGGGAKSNKSCNGKGGVKRWKGSNAKVQPDLGSNGQAKSNDLRLKQSDAQSDMKCGSDLEKAEMGQLNAATLNVFLAQQQQQQLGGTKEKQPSTLTQSQTGQYLYRVSHARSRSKSLSAAQALSLATVAEAEATAMGGGSTTDLDLTKQHHQRISSDVPQSLNGGRTTDLDLTKQHHQRISSDVPQSLNGGRTTDLDLTKQHHQRISSDVPQSLNPITLSHYNASSLLVPSRSFMRRSLSLSNGGSGGGGGGVLSPVGLRSGNGGEAMMIENPAMNGQNYSLHQYHYHQQHQNSLIPHPRATWPHAMLWGAGGDGGITSRSGSTVATVQAMEAVDFEELTFGKLLGQGSEGPVHAAWFRDTPVAVKRTHHSHEVDMHLLAGSHDNVVALRAVCSHSDYTYLIMELCPRGTLDVLIHSSAAPTLDPVKLLPIARSIARGMLHLHTRSPPLFHRDLKPSNVYVGAGMVMKIGDFGMARPATDTRLHPGWRCTWGGSKSGSGGTGNSSSVAGGSGSGSGSRSRYNELEMQRTLTPGVIGTAAYCAPEILSAGTPRAAQHENQDSAMPLDLCTSSGTNETGVNGVSNIGPEMGSTHQPHHEDLLKADVYSYGVLLWHLIERKRPYAGMDGFQIQTQWLLDPDSMKLPPVSVPEGLSPAAQKAMETLAYLVKACTAWEPSTRPSFKEISGMLRSLATEINNNNNNGID